MSPTILPFNGIMPKIADDAFIASNAIIIGDVEIGSGSSIWYNCVLRGDMNEIRVGERTNIQDGTIVHVDSQTFGSYIGNDVTIGHLALIHACTLEDGCMVGMNATVMDGAVVETGALVAAGALVAPGKRVTCGQMWAGTPARFARDIRPSDIEMMDYIAPGYEKLGAQYIAEGHDVRKMVMPTKDD